MPATKLSFNTLCFNAAEAFGIRVDDPKAIDYAVQMITLHRQCEGMMESIVAFASTPGSPLPAPVSDLAVPELLANQVNAILAADVSRS